MMMIDLEAPVIVSLMAHWKLVLIAIVAFSAAIYFWYTQYYLQLSQEPTPLVKEQAVKEQPASLAGLSTVEKLDNILASGNLTKEHVVVAFMVSSCGWCQKFAPVMQELRDQGNSKMGQLISIDARLAKDTTTSPILKHVINSGLVRALPTVVSFRFGENSDVSIRTMAGYFPTSAVTEKMATLDEKTAVTLNTTTGEVIPDLNSDVTIEEIPTPLPAPPSVRDSANHPPPAQLDNAGPINAKHNDGPESTTDTKAVLATEPALKTTTKTPESTESTESTESSGEINETPSQEQAHFIPSVKFAGDLPHYVFTTKSEGTGYYKTGVETIEK